MSINDDPSASQAKNTDSFEREPKIFDEVRKKLDLYKKFWHTRCAILNGEQLHELRPFDLESRGLMGPWSFNTTQSTIVTLGASAVSAILIHTLFPRLVIQTPPPSSKLIIEAAAWTERIYTFLRTGLLPFTLLASAKLIAWSSLHRHDRNSQAITRDTHAYLYIDGAYGLVPQFLGPIASSFSYADGKAGSDYLSAGYGILQYPIRAIIIWQFVLVIRVYKDELFRLNGYKTSTDDVSIISGDKQRGPSVKFLITALLGAPIIYGLVMGLAFCLSAVLGVIAAVLRL